MQKYFLVISFVVLLSTGVAYADNTIMITKSIAMDKVIFDGKWSFLTEWKKSSLDTLLYDDGTLIQLRTAHQDNFIYIFADVVSQTEFDKHGDMAIACFDMRDSKPVIPNYDDYCFLVSLGNKTPVVLQGGSPLGFTGGFKKIDNPEGLIGMASISDENDRYSVIPHPSYEFRIPTDLVGRSDVYGFYLGIYDEHKNKIYSWPKEIFQDSSQKIPSPSKWGDIISPDKSLPEFPFPILSLLSAIILAVYITRKKQFSFNPK
jgi:hypothetical protein